MSSHKTNQSNKTANSPASIDKANLHNLTRLWHKYGSAIIKIPAEAYCAQPGLRANPHWPHRCWFGLDGLVDDALAVLEHLSWIEHLPEGAIFPLLPFWAGSEALIEEALLAKHWRCSFEQTAMFLPLSLSQGSGSNTASDSNTAQRRPGFQVGTVTSLEQVQQWADIGGEAFAYDIDPGVIETLLEDGDIQLLLGWNNDIAIACGLLFKTGDTIGVHQVGVRQDFQGQGFARSFMLELISASTAWQGKNLVLQASEAGKPLYESLGFRTQFLIRNFQRLPV